MDRKAKERVVAELHEKLLRTHMAVFANFRGLNVEKMTELRNVLRKTDAELKVVKNTLLRIASQGTPYREVEELFKGPLTVTLSYGDVVQTTKSLVEFAKKNAEIEIKGGVLQGKPLTRDQVIQLAELPSREVLLSKLLGVLVAVPTSMVTVLAAVPRSFVQVLEAYRQKKEAEN